jgi:uncharacterized BrkB/YihY/UPF0761 family membrane protein
LPRSFTADQLVEVAARSAGSFVLHQQSQVALMEFFEEIVPRDRLQTVFSGVTGKIQAQDANIFASSGAAHAAWTRLALFRPFPNFVIVS